MIKSASGSGDVWLLPLDLASLSSVRACAAAFLAHDEPLHVLVNNAGRGRAARAHRRRVRAALRREPPRSLRADPAAARPAEGERPRCADRQRVERGALRRAGHRLRGAAAAHRDVHRPAASTPSPSCATCCSRQELARRLDGTAVHSYALHPGVVASDIWRRVPRLARWFLTRRMLTTEQGAVTSVYCATSPAVARRQRAVLRQVRGEGGRARWPPRSSPSCCGSTAPNGPGLG